MRVGQARKRDANENGIVAALEALGAVVLRLSGDGVPDLLVAYQGRWQPVEVKQPGGKLTPAQVRVQERTGFPVVESVDQALALFGVRG